MDGPTVARRMREIERERCVSSRSAVPIVAVTGHTLKVQRPARNAPECPECLTLALAEPGRDDPSGRHERSAR
jgi:hypothetical protein